MDKSYYREWIRDNIPDESIKLMEDSLYVPVNKSNENIDLVLTILPRYLKWKEKKFLVLTIRGCNQKEISERLKISEVYVNVLRRKIRSHVKNLLRRGN